MPKISKEKLRKAQVVATRSILAMLFVVFGILITAQWRSIPDRVTNPILPYASLKETKDSLYAEQADLKNEIFNLRTEIAETQKASEDITLSKSELASLRMKKAQAGLLKLNGQGVIITLGDSFSSPATDDSIIHAADLRDTVNLLWGSGAEAITINGQRVVLNTAIDCIVNTILVNDTKISAPFRIEAIGNQENMYQNLTNENFLADLHQRKISFGVKFDVSKNDDITCEAYNGSFESKTGENN